MFDENCQGCKLIIPSILTQPQLERCTVTGIRSSKQSPHTAPPQLLDCFQGFLDIKIQLFNPSQTNVIRGVRLHYITELSGKPDRFNQVLSSPTLLLEEIVAKIGMGKYFSTYLRSQEANRIHQVPQILLICSSLKESVKYSLRFHVLHEECHQLIYKGFVGICNFYLCFKPMFQKSH